MCGIVGYIGSRQALPVLLEGLSRLEYRGYDSAGVALGQADGVWLQRTVGRVADLKREVRQAPAASLGIAHTRWATHGGVTVANAHPHTDATGRIAVVHNGIIENMTALRAMLTAEGVVFRSETDTEVLPHLIRRHLQGDPVDAVRRALEHIRGTYGLVALFADHPDVLVVARNGSPLVVGMGDGEAVIASDPQAVVEHTRRVVYLQDRELAVVSTSGVDVRRFDGTMLDLNVELIDADYDVANREGFTHFMAKEIAEQPRSVRRCLRGRVDADEGNARLGGLQLSNRDLAAVQRVITIGCGTSYHAGMAGALAIEALARVPARAEIASEFRHRHPIILRDALFLAISQSGETADTLAALGEIQLKGGEVMGVVNVVGSTIARACGRGVYLHSGPEVAVASTKAFTSQVTALLLFTLMLARTRDLSLTRGQEVARALASVPEKVAHYLDHPGPIDAAVAAVKDARYVLFLGRGFSFPVALEGALKLKELAYIPCEAYPAGEMKHGPIAMLEAGTPVIFVAPTDDQRDKAISNMMEVKARGATLIVIHTAGDDEMAALADVAIAVPPVLDLVSPLVSVLPLQLIAFHTGLALGRDIDKPRNLAKSVTVE
ncbi:MAG: glutamine--fructose-6-phosphate transaminase (isomerizing) [Alphaproteobacteria bacterium]|nr:glutamine--fructose-6-phosphate transaminase (isomerizing) [Alphaproteobacteria bacterium]